MNIKYIFTQLIFLCSIHVFCQHGEVKTMEQVTLEDNLFQIQWMDNVGDSEKNIVKLGLTSQNTAIQLEAIQALSIHFLEEFKFELSNLEQSTKSTVSSELCSIILDGFQQSEAIFFQFLRSKVIDTDFNSAKSFESHEHTTVSDIIVSILVTVKCKRLRQGIGISFDLSESWLNDYQKMVLSYSKLPEEVAINQIFSKVQYIDKALTFEYDLLKVLNSYGIVAVSKTANKISTPDSLKTTSSYGRIILLTNLKQNARLLSIDDKQKLGNVLSDENLRNAYFDSPPSLKILTIILDEHLSPNINYDNIRNRIEALGDKQKKEELLNSLKEKMKKDSPQNNFDKDESSPQSSILSPEEQGEDFSIKGNQELINFLKSSEDIIELRKAAYELGNRFIQRNYQPSDADKEIIKSLVDNCFKMAKSSDANTREEGRFQIHRLWRLAVPRLLEYLTDDDPTKMELAAKCLILMRDEAIISAVINITEQTTDSRKKKLLKFVLTKMNEQRTTIVPNRKCMSQEISKELYDRLVVPALNRMK